MGGNNESDSEERALARVSKDGCTARTRCHPSRRALKGAPQDEVFYFFTRSFAGDDTPFEAPASAPSMRLSGVAVGVTEIN
jgi:hypothetical protein